MEVVKPPESEFVKLLQVRFQQLPSYDQKFFQYGSVLIGLSASTSGLLCNQAFRQVMKIRRGFLFSSIIVTGIPLFQLTVLYQFAIPKAIMAGKMTCPLCNTVRGTCVGAIAGGLGSASLAALMSTLYFIKYDKKPLPTDLFRFSLNLYKPALMKLKYFFFFQALFSMAVSVHYYTIYEKMLVKPSLPMQEDERQEE
ncbi:transmembrane protein 126A-like [Eleutherodactylus coqui]|uniref:transmembrane protein 126A-like n=1 Tax=Eleutherodactylus coqui TaxID=57060 RepID=UPI003462AE5B